MLFLTTSRSYHSSTGALRFIVSSPIFIQSVRLVTCGIKAVLKVLEKIMQVLNADKTLAILVLIIPVDQHR